MLTVDRIGDWMQCLWRSGVYICALAAGGILVVPAMAQELVSKHEVLQIRHAPSTPVIDCRDDRETWGRVSPFVISKSSLGTSASKSVDPPAMIFLVTDPEEPPKNLPEPIQKKIDKLQVRYRFLWDAKRLYAFVEWNERKPDVGHPQVSEGNLQQSFAEAALADLLFSTVVVEIGGPSWQGWITEMHVHVRAPHSKQPSFFSFCRTNDEERFKPLNGQAVACTTQDGWIAKFAVDWLPFNEWQVKAGTTADLRLMVPIANNGQGYVLATVVPFALANE